VRWGGEGNTGRGEDAERLDDDEMVERQMQYGDAAKIKCLSWLGVGLRMGVGLGVYRRAVLDLDGGTRSR